MEQLWVNPAISTNPSRRHGPLLNQDFVRVASELAPTVSPAPPGNAIVPAGWVLQMGDEGEVDTLFGNTRTTGAPFLADITQPTVPLYNGGWPPDPLLGQPGHTPVTDPGSLGGRNR